MARDDQLGLEHRSVDATAAGTAAHLPAEWERRLLAVLDASDSTSNRIFLTAWAKAEGGSAHFNPLNTTLKLPGALTYNQAGVRSYLDGIQGICATALTLRLPAYAGIVRDLRVGELGELDLVRRNRVALNTWGTGWQAVLRVLRSR